MAAAKLGVTEKEVKVTVLEETKGLFGKSSVRVRAEVKAAPSKKEPKAKKEPKIEAKAEAPSAEPTPAPEPKRVRSKKAEKPVTAKDDEESEGTEEADYQATQEDAEGLAEIINEILDLAKLQATVEPRTINGKYVNLELDGQDVAYLVGKHGEVLNAFQYYLNVVAARQLNTAARATLDGNQYRHRREEALTNLALQIAEQVKQRKEEAVLDALPAFERRVVHKALQEFAGVTTYSEGEEPGRRVVIAPEG